jgi:hypothetical protein
LSAVLEMPSFRFDSAANAQSDQDILAPIGIAQTGSLMQRPIQRPVGTVVISDREFADAPAR